MAKSTKEIGKESNLRLYSRGRSVSPKFWWGRTSQKLQSRRYCRIFDRFDQSQPVFAVTYRNSEEATREDLCELSSSTPRLRVCAEEAEFPTMRSRSFLVVRIAGAG